MKATRTTSNFTKRDAINARNGIPLKNVDQMVIPIEKLAIGTDKMEDGDEREVSVLVSTDGDVYTTISPTVIAMVDEAIDLIEEGEEIAVQVIKRTSTKGREFIALKILDR